MNKIPPDPSNEGKTIWLRDLLTSGLDPSSLADPEHHSLLKGGLENAHITTFGYDWTRAAGEGLTLGDDLIKPVALELLKAVNWGSRDQVTLNARNPLVFVAMDIGGAIIKEV